MDNGTRVNAITAENYQDVVNRATEVRERMKKHYEETGGFPSLRYVIETWGFQMSLKAMWRHRNTVMKELGISSPGRPTDQLPRRQRTPGPAEPATVEQPETETVS